MPDLIDSLQDTINDLYDEIKDDSELLLDQIDIDTFLENPKAYLEELSRQFLQQHLDEIEEAALAGEEFANKTMKG
jgi:hypothetical protein